MSKTIITTVLISLVLGIRITLADSSDVPLRNVPLSPHQIIVLAAQEYAAPVDELLTVGHCESGTKEIPFNQAAIGLAGEIGTFQYFQSTWNTMSKTMGQKLDIHSIEDQAKLTAWVYANHPEWKIQWSTYRYWYAEKHYKCRA